jgi:hypothetical protein
MPSIVTDDIIRDVSIILHDAINTRWTKAELLGWLNGGQREIVIHKPNACVKNVEMTLVAGTKQAAPVDCNSIIDIPRNTQGYAIRITNKDSLDAQMPDWHLQSKASSRVMNYCYSDDNPKIFYVYPASPGGNKVDISYSANPATVALGDVIAISDIYASALLDYIAYRAFGKEMESASSTQKSITHYQDFSSAIKGSAQSEDLTNPNSRFKKRQTSPNIV